MENSVPRAISFRWTSSTDAKQHFSIAGLPVEAKAVFEYWSKSDAGAILLTASPITKEGFFHEHVFVEWVLENAIQLLKLYPVLFTHDLWVVTTTFSTKYCSHTVWSDKSKRVHVGFAVKQAGVGGMGPSGTWYEDHENDSWEKYGNDNVSAEIRLATSAGNEKIGS
jgi:hypothetical protein